MAVSPKKKKSKNDPFPKIRAIIAKQLKKEPAQIGLKAKLQTDLGADSLDALEIIFQLEEDFDIKIGEEEAKKMESVQDIVTAITKKIKENNRLGKCSNRASVLKPSRSLIWEARSRSGRLSKNARKSMMRAVP